MATDYEHTLPPVRRFPADLLRSDVAFAHALFLGSHERTGMSAQTEIEWTDFSWSPWWGCTPVSPGCANCYASALANWTRGLRYRKGVPRQRTKDWKAPRRWNAKAEETGLRKRVFPSMCDPFDREVPADWLADFLGLIYETPWLDWQLLTKRPQDASDALLGTSGAGANHVAETWPNLWLGVSAENQEQADLRIPILLEIPMRVLFVSAEPLLGPVTLRRAYGGAEERYRDFLIGERGWTMQHVAVRPEETRALDWVIIGGESGRSARPCNIAWVRRLASECESAGVAGFVKQLGSEPFYCFEAAQGAEARIPLEFKHKKGGNPAEWPIDLQNRRSFPIPRQ